MYRLTFLSVFVGIIVLLFVFTAKYAEFASSRKRRLRLAHVLFFYVLSILSFGKTYWMLCYISRDLFTYSHPPTSVTPLLTDLTLDSYKLFMEFTLFSALQSNRPNGGPIGSPRAKRV